MHVVFTSLYVCFFASAFRRVAAGVVRRFEGILNSAASGFSLTGGGTGGVASPLREPTAQLPVEAPSEAAVEAIVEALLGGPGGTVRLSLSPSL